MQSLFCQPCENAGPDPAGVGSCDHCGQMKTRLIQLYIFWPGETSSLPLQILLLWVPAGWAAVSLPWMATVPAAEGATKHPCAW